MSTRYDSNPWPYLSERWQIEFITHEACGVGLRARVDVGPQGEYLLDRLFGGIALTHPGWRHPDWKTAMIPRGLLEDLYIFGLLHHHDVVLRIDRSSINGSISYHGYSRKEFQEIFEDDIPTLRKNAKVNWWVKRGDSLDGLMNRHAFTGRVL